MKFFMNRHYSTAQKIIDTIEKKIISALAKHPTIISANQNYDVLTFTTYLSKKRKLAEILGDSLRNSLPNNLYDKYQRLKQDEKEELRERIANDYFRALELSTEKFSNLDIKISIKSDHWGDDVYAKISFPNEFTDKDKLSKELSRSLASVQKELIESNNDAFQSQFAL